MSSALLVRQSHLRRMSRVALEIGGIVLGAMCWAARNAGARWHTLAIDVHLLADWRVCNSFGRLLINLGIHPLCFGCVRATRAR